MNILLIVAFLFSMGSFAGWGLEVFFRRFFSDANPERRWINPGFMTGPYLPLYGFSLVTEYFLAHINLTFISNPIAEKLVLFMVMAIVITAIEYIAGEIFIHRMKIKLWDYTEEWGNIKGIICPRFSFYWSVLSAIYYFLIHPRILSALIWLSNNLTFSFFIGFFYGVFVLDFWYTMNMMTRIRTFANEHEIIVRYEMLKATVREKNEEYRKRKSFILSYVSDRRTFSEGLTEYFNRISESIEKTVDKTVDTIGKTYDKTVDTLGKTYDKTVDTIGKAKDITVDTLEKAKEMIMPENKYTESKDTESRDTENKDTESKDTENKDTEAKDTE